MCTLCRLSQTGPKSLIQTVRTKLVVLITKYMDTFFINSTCYGDFIPIKETSIVSGFIALYRKRRYILHRKV